MVYTPQGHFLSGLKNKLYQGSCFLLFYVYRPQNCGKIVISDCILPSGRGGVKIWGLLFFGYSQSFSRNWYVYPYSVVQPPVSSMA